MKPPFNRPFNKQQDVSDATILSEQTAAVPSSPDSTSNQVIDLEAVQPNQAKKPNQTNQANQSEQSAATNGGVQGFIKQAAAAAAMGAAQKAVNHAADRMLNPRPQPTWAFARQSSAHLIALGFGSGLMRIAPGTWGTLFGWVTFNYLLASLSSYTQAWVIAAAFAVGVWACGKAGKALGVIDHGAWVWDEIVAFWLILWLIPSGFTAQLWAFVLFRLFDIVKPPPIRYFDTQLKNGFGVMFDDLLAAAYTLLVIALWHRLFFTAA